MWLTNISSLLQLYPRLWSLFVDFEQARTAFATVRIVVQSKLKLRIGAAALAEPEPRLQIIPKKTTQRV